MDTMDIIDLMDAPDTPGPFTTKHLFGKPCGMADETGPFREDVITLACGRSLGVAEFGNPKGLPLFWFHGTPGARRQVPPLARDAAAARGLRLIGVERPGIGDSTTHRYPGLSHFAADLEEIADRLGAGRFGLLGLSGGGPYVLACAHRMPDRVVAGAIFGGVAPVTGDERASGGAVRLAVPLRWLIDWALEPIGNGLGSIVRGLAPIRDAAFPVLLQLVLAPNDRAILLEPRMREVFIGDMLQGARNGMHVLLLDLLLFSQPWDFSLRDVRVPIHFFQGDADALVPFDHGTHMAALVPDATFTHMPGMGHLGTLEATDTAIDFVLSHWKQRRRAAR